MEKWDANHGMNEKKKGSRGNAPCILDSQFTILYAIRVLCIEDPPI